MTERAFDAVVLGAGPAGEVAAGRLAEAGLTVAIAERELVGGECSYWACMPSKALLRPAEALDEARRVPGAAEALTGELDVGAVLARRDEVVHDLDDAAQLPWLAERGIELVRGHARLEAERRVRVGDDVLVARRAVIVATGSASVEPPLDGLGEAGAWSNREITTARAVPGRLAVLGGGVVGVEMAQAWASLGARVTVIEAGERLLGGEEPFACEQVAAALRERGAELRLGARAERVRRAGGELAVGLAGGDTVVADELLVAVGRRPRTDDLGLERVGLEPGAAIDVDDGLRATGVDGGWLYAIGDVNGRVLLTHAGKHQARVAARNIVAGHEVASVGATPSPRVVFSDPQVAAVGHTLDSARAAGLHVRAVDAETNGNAGGSFHGRGAPGTARLVVDTDRAVLAGATMTGPGVAEMLHAATVAIAGEVPLARLADAVPVFPTRNEVWLDLLEGLGL